MTKRGSVLLDYVDYRWDFAWMTYGHSYSDVDDRAVIFMTLDLQL